MGIRGRLRTGTYHLDSVSPHSMMGSISKSKQEATSWGLGDLYAEILDPASKMPNFLLLRWACALIKWCACQLIDHCFYPILRYYCRRQSRQMNALRLRMTLLHGSGRQKVGRGHQMSSIEN
jgi:hypothetical protein